MLAKWTVYGGEAGVGDAETGISLSANIMSVNELMLIQRLVHGTGCCCRALCTLLLGAGIPSRLLVTGH